MVRPLIGSQRGKVSVLGYILNEVYGLVGKASLCGEVPTVIHHILQDLLHHICQVLCQNIGGLRFVNRRNGFAGVWNLRKLAVQGSIDDLFVKARRQHYISLFLSALCGCILYLV